MFAKRKIRSKRKIWTVAYGLLLLGLLLAFLVTIDGPLTNLASNGTAIAHSKTNGLSGSEHGMERGPATLAILHNEPAVPPASFFLFDYKQNLRLWPVLAGDISRSPPLFDLPYTPFFDL
ncbi:MAG TPA: hypothetical protein VLJ79_13860 [Candidatus Binatia bacterium]|nr:hypothetical protein [Candidatus Binatia bacterium]